MIFDGKAFAREIEEQVRTKVASMEVKPKIVSIVVGDDPASALYTRLKEQAAQRVGIDFEVQRVSNLPAQAGIEYREFEHKVRTVGDRQDVTGVMVQLPIPGLQGQALKEVLSAIPLSKDVDGLRWEESGIKPATVRAILAILDKIALESRFKIQDSRVVVLGARGAVGRPLCHFLRERGVEVNEVEWDTPDPARTVLAGEVVISCVGKAGLLTGEMVRDGVVAIDVGMSHVEGKVVGDMTEEVYQKAGVAVPVPGGVGPVTIACLMESSIYLMRGSAYEKI